MSTQGGVWPEGVFACQGMSACQGVSAQGMSAWGVSSCQGVCLRGVSHGGVYLPGGVCVVCKGGCLADTTPPPVDRMLVKTLPFRNFVCGR